MASLSPEANLTAFRSSSFLTSEKASNLIHLREADGSLRMNKLTWDNGLLFVDPTSVTLPPKNGAAFKHTYLQTKHEQHGILHEFTQG